MTAKRAAALELAADAYWEADVRLKVRKLVLLGSDERCRSLHGLDGMNLSLHLDVDKQGLESTFFGVRLRLPQADRSPIAVSVSGMRTRDADGWFGTAHLMDAQSAVRTDYSHAKDLVIRLEEARRSEAVLRAEAETVLDGLRILLRPEPSAKLFTALLARLAEPLEFQDAVILERDWTGDTHLCAATGDCLSAIDWSAFDPSLFDLEDLASLHVPSEILGADGPEGREIPPWASGLAIRLSGGSKPALLLCLHRVPGFFTQRHLGLGARLALVANQALLAEEERRKVVQAAKLASIGELAAGIVHEVNQPLSAIKLAVQGLELLLEDDKLTSEQLGAKLERVDGEVDRIANIVRAMRVLARKSDSEHAPFNVAEAANEAISIVRHRLRAEAIELLADIPETITAHGSRLEFAQVVLNVVGNAIDAIRLHRRDNGAETNESRISVTAAVGPQGVVELCVRDTGPGIPQAQVDKVLEPFFTTKPSGEGTGLGLSLCQRMMRSMEGDIRIGNWEGGAEVRLELPSSPSITTLDDSHMERE
jgi:signal transduction histidine kinase